MSFRKSGPFILRFQRNRLSVLRPSKLRRANKKVSTRAPESSYLRCYSLHAPRNKYCESIKNCRFFHGRAGSYGENAPTAPSQIQRSRHERMGERYQKEIRRFQRGVVGYKPDNTRNAIYERALGRYPKRHQIQLFWETRRFLK